MTMQSDDNDTKPLTESDFLTVLDAFQHRCMKPLRDGGRARQAAHDSIVGMFRRALAERGELRKWRDRVAAALDQSENGGILYAAIPAAITQLRERAKEAEAELAEERRLHAEERGIHKGLLAEIAELRERVEKLDGDVDHFHRKWKEAETRAEKAELERGRVQADFEAQRSWGWKMKQRAEKAEADAKRDLCRLHNEAATLIGNAKDNGVAMLRRLEVGLRKISFQWSQDRVAVLGEVQRMIAEAEKPAEPEDGMCYDEPENREGVAMLRRLREKVLGATPGPCEGADPVAREIRAKAQAFRCVLGWIGDLIAEAEKPAENLTTDPTDGEDSHREGDEVLRAFLNDLEKGFPPMQAGEGEASYNTRIGLIASVQVLGRRALGEGGAR